MNAVTYLGEALIIARMMSNRQAESNIYSHLGTAYGIMKSFPLAIDYHTKAHKINKQLGDKSSVAKTLHHLGKLYFELHDYVACKKSYLEALDTALEANDDINESRIYIGLAILYKKFTDYKSTENYVNKALVLAAKRNALKELINIHNILSDCDKENGRYDSSIKNLELSKSYEKNILNLEEERKIRNIILHKSFQFDDKLNGSNGHSLNKLKKAMSNGHSLNALRMTI